jgi:hypothetical protein
MGEDAARRQLQLQQSDLLDLLIVKEQLLKLGNKPATWNETSQMDALCADGWTGLECDEHGQLTAIDLSDTDLRGNIGVATWSSGMTSMARLNLANTAVSGDIASWASSPMAQMEVLILAGTAVSGDISGWSASAMTNLRELHLQRTRVSGDISAWAGCPWTKLQRLDLGGTGVSRGSADTRGSRGFDPPAP